MAPFGVAWGRSELQGMPYQWPLLQNSRFSCLSLFTARMTDFAIQLKFEVAEFVRYLALHVAQGSESLA